MTNFSRKINEVENEKDDKYESREREEEIQTDTERKI